MATIEFRRSASGRITAVRAKLRRAGLPHLCRTFAVATGESPSAAEARARAWAAGAEQALLATPPAPSVPASAPKASAEAPPHAVGTLAKAWTRATAHGQQSRTAAKAAVAISRDPVDRALLALGSESGLSADDLPRLRWQHLRIDLPSLEIPGPGGVLRAPVPISRYTLDALLALPGRKQGLLFKMAPDALARRLRALARAVPAADGSPDGAAPVDTPPPASQPPLPARHR